MKFKMIVSDYDNTICNKEKIVTDRTRAAIKQFIDNGGRFVVCTTRPYIGIVNYAKDIGLRDEVIANQGATIRNLFDDSVVFQSLFSDEETLEILDFFDPKSAHIFISSDYDMRSKSNDLFTYICGKSVGYPLIRTQSSLQQDCNSIDVAQIIVGAYLHKNVLRLERSAKRRFKDKYEIGVCDRFLLNLTQKGVSKGHAIQQIASLHSIDKQEIIAFGDSPNDAPMFDFAGVGVAMGNSLPSLKKVATDVCGDVEDDGLAEYIEKYCL